MDVEKSNVVAIQEEKVDSISTYGKEEKSSIETKSDSYNGIYDENEKVVMNGAGNKQLGKRGVATFDKDTITEESLIRFYNDKIKDSGYMSYTLINKNEPNKGMVFAGCYDIAGYGEIDEGGSIIKNEKTIMIQEDKVVVAK